MKVRELAGLQLDCIARDRVMHDGINAILEVNPDVRHLADALDQLPNSSRGPLHGVTVVLKDNINTADRMHTSAGALVLESHFAAEDAYIVKRLRQAGALILGKANMTEFANFMSFDMPPGYSSRGGYVRNPHNLTQSPSGSSSGSAAAVAAGFSTAAIGTETSGSIISPCQNCGVVGVKPTIGLVSRTGIIPISRTLDTAGPIAADVKTAAMLLHAIAGYDADDPATHMMQNRAVPDYIKALDANSLYGARIGVNRGIEPSIGYRPHSKKLLRFIEELGAELIEIEPVPLQMQVRDIMNYEFKAALEHYLATAGRNADPRTLADIIAFNAAHPETALRYGQSRMEYVFKEASRRMDEPEYLQALDLRYRLADKLCNIFEKDHLDGIIEAAGYNSIAPFTGFPVGTVPIGYYDNCVPVGSYLMCRPFEEAKLLSLLYSMEQNLKTNRI